LAGDRVSRVLRLILIFGVLAADAVAGPLVWGPAHRVPIALSDPLEDPFYWWPRTLLSYPVQFDEPTDLRQLVLKRESGEVVPIQWSDAVMDGVRVSQATLNFFSDLPSGGHRQFVLTAGSSPPPKQSILESNESETIVLNVGPLRVRLPASQSIHGPVPGPILALCRGGEWFGSSHFELPGISFTQIEARKIESGPLFVTYRLTYKSASGARYIATIRCVEGLDFVQLQEDMEGLPETARGAWKFSWNGLQISYRQSSNHPFPFPTQIAKYDDYQWEPISQRQMNTHLGVLSGMKDDGELPFSIGVYEPWWAFTTSSFANFWGARSDAAGIFIDRVENWQDHDYAIWHASAKLQVQFFYKNETLLFHYPLARGKRSTCLALYDHAKDIETMHRLEQAVNGETGHDGLRYKAHLTPTSYTLFLQNRYGTIDLNKVKDWVLTEPPKQDPPRRLFSTGLIASAEELERRVFTSDFVGELPVAGTRQNGGFGPVASREILDWWIDGFDRFRGQMTELQRRRLTAMYLFMAYVHADEDYMPMVPMLSGHPNFLADVKSVPPSIAFLFPWHPQAPAWAEEFEKFVELNTRYHTRPAVTQWESRGGRWTENLGTYVWAALRPSLRADFLLKQYDGTERLVTPQVAQIGNWLVDSLSAPFDGELQTTVQRPGFAEDNHEWGVVMPGEGPRRVYPPMGAHSERRIPPRALWYLGHSLARYAPLTAEHLMWAARSSNQDMETPKTAADPWKVMFEEPDDRGTDPHLRSSKYTGFGITLRAAVGTRDEVSIHLQQIDDGPNYRWGNAGQGGGGVLYFFAGGKSYSHNGMEDVGDRAAQDTDFCTSFGVYKNGGFRSIGPNVLSRPLYDLEVAQFAELVPRGDANSYSAPEYVSRSVLLAGHDYFVLYDDMFNESVVHRLSWFVRRGEELPFIQLTKGAPRGIETQQTRIETGETSGVWFDGKGDSMAIVSHRKDLIATATPFGANVHGPGVDDLVFRNPEGIHYAAAGVNFEGTAGIVRTGAGTQEFALFHGTHIAVPGFGIATNDTELGVAAAMQNGKSVSGEYYAPKATTCQFELGSLAPDGKLYIDGDLQTTTRSGSSLLAELSKGRHHWEITSRQPVPIAPKILHTDNFNDGATVLAEAVPSASKYRLEISSDNGRTWTGATESSGTQFRLRGLGNDHKVHVRAIALNTDHESQPGPEYPIYITAKPPLPPDGLVVDGASTISWGEELGVTKYRLYARKRGDSAFRLLYEGSETHYRAESTSNMEYRLTAVNGNGEGPPSRIVDSDPACWRNWEPQPGEPFRRTNVRSGSNGASDYYPM